MKTHHHSPKTCGAGVCAGPLSAYLETFRLKDQALGYKQHTCAQHRLLLGRLNLWLVRNGRRLEDIDEHLIECFVPHADHHQKAGARTTLRRFLELLREAGAIGPAKPVMPACPVEALVRDYKCFLINECGLAAGTVYVRALYASRFLSSWFGTGPVRLEQLRARDLIAFVSGSARQFPRGHVVRHLAAGMRSFLRFARLRGLVASDLAASVPRLASWKQAGGLPGQLPEGGTEQALAHCDLRRPEGMRDYAVLMLLAHLGLRAGEVAALRLEDIDWAAAQLTVRPKKGGGWSRLPLRREVGAALARYLKRARPKCASRHVFVRMGKAPFREFASSMSICIIARNALMRAGVKLPRMGAHVFRHTLARNLLKRGASLEQIGRVLRHKSMDATAIYAKVDLEGLRSVAMPWMGGAL